MPRKLEWMPRNRPPLRVRRLSPAWARIYAALMIMYIWCSLAAIVVAERLFFRFIGPLVTITAVAAAFAGYIAWYGWTIRAARRAFDQWIPAHGWVRMEPDDRTRWPWTADQIADGDVTIYSVLGGQLEGPVFTAGDRSSPPSGRSTPIAWRTRHGSSSRWRHCLT